MDICRKTILKTAGAFLFAAVFCVGCYDLGIEPSVPTPTVETFVDGRDGRTYKKVKIGTQTWMAENLKYAADGSMCHDGAGWGRTPDQTCEEFGRLYDWQTAMDYVPSSDAVPSGVEGVCPIGWHIPSDAEWTKLTEYVGINGATKLKSKTFRGGQPGSVKVPDGTDIYNFSALHGPYASFWWSSTEYEGGNAAWVREIIANETYVLSWHREKQQFLSVRCLHD